MYTIDQNDGSSPDSSDFLPNRTAYSVNHSWDTAGKYTVTVTADDNQTTTPSETTIYIDARPVGDIGYITDDDADGTYDTFHGNDGVETTLGMEDGKYLIDSDDDSDWEWIYDPETDTLEEYQAAEETAAEDYTSIILLIIIIIIVLIILYFLMRRGGSAKKTQEPAKKETKKSSKKK